MATEEPTTPENPEFGKLFEKLNNEATQNYITGFENLVKSDEFSYNGETEKLKMKYPIGPDEYFELQDLKAETLSEDDRKKYIENFRRRACILIEGMTPERFNGMDFYTMMKVITAWSSRATNFR